MLFNSWTFLLFFLIVFFLHRNVPGWTSKKLILLLASYVFYFAWNPPYVVILVFSTALDWQLARWIARSEEARKRRLLLMVSLISNLGLLCFFKYGHFLVEEFRATVAVFGVIYQPMAFDIILPIGISFYTFASLSYTIDVYRREIPADSSLLDYALFVGFFPHLVAGPIVRARQFLPQFKEPRQASQRQIGWGLVLVVFGLFSKVVLADDVFAPVVDTVYANPLHAGALDSWAAVLGFSGQIYYDFCGYSLCAIGLASCFGFAFPDNFRYPFAARGFSDFWRRWHITLSSWLRDYLYVPLGGNRHGEGRARLNVMLTMLIGGLWHGASWMFVLWGGLHGVLLVIERLFRSQQQQVESRGVVSAWALATFTFLVITLAWIPFRASSTQIAGEVLAGLLRFNQPLLLGATKLSLGFATIAATFGWHVFQRNSSLEERFGKMHAGIQTAVLALCLVAMFLMSGRGGGRAFIYFQF